jgi:hypothetical protein
MRLPALHGRSFVSRATREATVASRLALDFGL